MVLFLKLPMTKMSLHQLCTLQFSPQVDRTSARSFTFPGALWAAMTTLKAETMRHLKMRPSLPLRQLWEPL
jgi:hypothetical protein